MFSLRARKILSDLATSKTRTSLVVVCIAVGVFAVGMIAGSRVVLLHNLATSYEAAKAANVTLVTDPFEKQLVDDVRLMPGVREAEGRAILNVRLQVGPQMWRDLQLFALRDFNAIRVNKIYPEQGAFPPPKRQVLLERTSLAFIGDRVGDEATIETPDGKKHTVKFAGSVHDLNQPASSLTGSLYGYVTFDTWEWLGQPRMMNELLVISEDPSSQASVQKLAAQVDQAVRNRGHRVWTSYVPEPGKLWVNGSVDSMLLLLGALGVLCLLLSAFLVVTTTNALLAQQVWEIGVMKAIGARRGAMLEMYLSTVALFGMLALVVAIPLGIVGSILLIAYSTALLNLDNAGYAIAPEVIGLQIATGLLVPVFAAFYPILAGSRITVREAMGAYGLGTGGFGQNWFDRLINHVRRLPRPLLMSLRNTFRRKGRLALALATLTFGGAIFISVMTVRASLISTLAEIYGYRQFDLQLTFTSPHSVSGLEREALTVPGVVQAESWGMTTAEPWLASNRMSDNIRVIGLPAQSALISPTMLAGRWLLPDDQNALVINTDVLTGHPGLKVDDPLTLKMGGHLATWRVVGIIRGVPLDPVAYVSYPAYARVMREEGLAESLQVVTAQHEASSEARLMRTLEEHFSKLGMPITATGTTADRHQFDQSGFDIIIGFLSAMAVLLALVGGISLMGTMSINVLERTREIGVLRAIGAPTGAIMQIVIGEGILVGIMSAILGSLLSLPLSQALSESVGLMFVHASLTYTFSIDGVLLWLVLVILLGALASFLPALNAAKVTVRDALAYE